MYRQSGVSGPVQRAHRAGCTGPNAGVRAVRIGVGSLSAPPLALPLRLRLSSPPITFIVSQDGRYGQRTRREAAGGANCCNHCEAARALSPSPEPMPSAAPEVPQWGSNKILYLAETERLGRIERHRRRTGALQTLEKVFHQRVTHACFTCLVRRVVLTRPGAGPRGHYRGPYAQL